MTDDVSKLVFEQLQLLRKGQEQILHSQQSMRADISDLKTRIMGFEATLGHIMAQLGHMQSQIAIQSGGIDRVDERMSRMENRLDGIERHLTLTHAL